MPDRSDDVRAYLRAIGSNGGKRGGKARWKNVGREERSRQMKAIRAQALVKPKKKR